MDARTRMRWFQAAARGWLTLAVMSLALAPAARRGLWLPLHLTLTGAASAAIGGAMPWFVLALTATDEPSTGSFVTRFLATNLGVAAMAAAVLGGPTWLLPAGGAAFVVGQMQLGWLLLRARIRSLHRRHGVPLALYAAAVLTVIAGATFGALLGGGAFSDPETYLAIRRTHLALNLVGWLSLTIAASLITLLPTVLRVRIPTWPARVSATALIAGVAALAFGTATSVAAFATIGAVSVILGTIAVVTLALRSLRAARSRRDTPLPAAAMHFLAALGWFVIGTIVLASSVAGGVDGVDAARDPFLAILVVGWVAQVLLGAWSYLLPMVRPGHPDARRSMFAVMEVGARTQVIVLNLGVALLAVAPEGSAASAVGWAIVIAATLIVLLKAWTFGPLSRLPLPEGAFRAWSAADAGLRP